MKSIRIVFHSFMIISIMISFVVLSRGYGIKYNLSPSLPYTLFLSTPLTAVSLDQIVSFKHQATSAIFAKMIAGVPGDIIKVIDQKIYLNGIEKGSLVNGFEPAQDGIIPSGYYFVMGLHEESFDSRYQEFGLIPFEGIRENLWPIF